jgi:hypothetical protein
MPDGWQTDGENQVKAPGNLAWRLGMGDVR